MLEHLWICTYLDSRYLSYIYVGKYVPISIFEGFLSTFTLYGFQGTSNIDSYIELLRFISFHFKKRINWGISLLKNLNKKVPRQKRRGTVPVLV